jgi:hypothetical protein
MPGSLNEILPEPVSEENERILLAHMKHVAGYGVGVAVRLLHAMEERFGPEAREVVADMIAGLQPSPRPDAGEPRADLHEFCDRLEKGCVGSHRWERVVDEEDRVGYRFTRCLWAELYRELGEPELGFLMCAGDEPGVKSYNPRLGFKRKKVLMHGDDHCDHVFYVEERD